MSFATCPQCSTRRPVRPEEMGKALRCSVCGQALAPAAAEEERTVRVNSGIFDRRAEKGIPAKEGKKTASTPPPTPRPDATIKMKASDLLGGKTGADLAGEASLGEMEMPANMKFSLEVLNGPHKGRTLEVSENPFTLGRDFWDVGGKDAQISRVHAAVEVYGTRGAVVRDVGSTNGTFVNGRLVTAARLKSGDLIRLGPVELRWKAGK